MNAVEAMQALLDGKKIRDKGWHDNSYIKMNEFEEIIHSAGHNHNFSVPQFMHFNWELYEEPEDTKLYQWAVRYVHLETWVNDIIATEKQAKEYYKDIPYIEYKKLDDLLGGQGK